MSEVVKAALAEAGLKVGKRYGVTVIVCDHSDGVIDQIIPITEFSETAPENVFKYQWIADAIVEAMNGNNESGSGGVLREMGEMFQAAAFAAGGNVEKAMEGFIAAAAAHGQGKKPKTKTPAKKPARGK